MPEDSLAMRDHSLRGETRMFFARSSSDGAAAPGAVASLVAPESRAALEGTASMASAPAPAGPAWRLMGAESALPHRLQNRAESLAIVPHWVHRMMVSLPFF